MKKLTFYLLMSGMITTHIIFCAEQEHKSRAAAVYNSPQSPTPGTPPTQIRSLLPPAPVTMQDTIMQKTKPLSLSDEIFEFENEWKEGKSKELHLARAVKSGDLSTVKKFLICFPELINTKSCCEPNLFRQACTYQEYSTAFWLYRFNLCYNHKESCNRACLCCPCKCCCCCCCTCQGCNNQ